MEATVTNKLNRWNNLLRILIAIACSWFLYREFFIRKKFTLLWEQFSSIDLSGEKLIWLVIILLLVFVNWGLETSKWRLLISKVEKVSWLTACEAVISGISISIFTPNRVGEFAARIFYLETSHRVKGILISIIGSVSQLCVTLVIGSFSFSYFLITRESFAGLEKMLMIMLALITSFIVTLFYFNMDILRTLLLKINKARKTRFYLNVFTFYSVPELSVVLLYSFLRYIVFSIQYFLLMRFFDIQIPVFESFIMISAIFFVLAIIPTIALAELGIRGATAIYFLSAYSTNSLGVLASSYGLWCINLALPAILGMLFLPQLKFFKK